MAYSTINKSTDYFNDILYTGNGTDNHAITGVGFQPDFTWIKPRNEARGHAIFDAVRGATKMIIANENSAEGTYATSLKSFNSDGFTLGTSNDVNKSSNTHAAWNWKANGSGSANTDGSINTTVSANTTAGFSIITYTGNGSAGATIGHGLGVVPKMVMAKKLNGSPNWAVYHAGMGSASKFLELNTTAVESTNNAVWDGATPTTSVVYLGSDNRVNSSGDTYVAYCFAEIKGYSKIGKYQGTGNSAFIYTGFKPKFILGKEYSASNGYNWHLFSTKLTGRFEPSNNVAEYTDYPRVVDWCSNGFRWRTSLNNWDNSDARSYVYYAVGQSMVGSNNVPSTAGSTDG